MPWSESRAPEVDLAPILAKLPEPEAVASLQHTMVEAAQNGADSTVTQILNNDKARKYVDLDGKDDAGNTALVYASCFGHDRVAQALLSNGANPNISDKNEWTPLMWAVNNNHLEIVKQLLANGVNTSLKTSTGRSAFYLLNADSTVSLYLSAQGYIPASGVDSFDLPTDALDTGFGGSFYQEAVDPLEMEQRFSNELKESADILGGFGAAIDDADRDVLLPTPLTQSVDVDFDWENFKVSDSLQIPRELIPDFLDLVITQVQPTLKKMQAPTSANALYLATRYFYFCGTSESFLQITSPVCRRIEMCVRQRPGDLAYLSYWLSNAEAYLYYLRKDPRLSVATYLDLQPMVEELCRNIILQIEEFTHKLLLPLMTTCLLNYDSIPEYGKVEYRDEWKLFRSSSKLKHDSLEEVAQKHMLPPSYETLMKNPGPQRVTSVLSSLLFLFQIYGVHSVTQAQIIASLLYFISSRMFNTIVGDRKYLNRRRAMQIRLNISVVEDWCRNHNFRPDAVEVTGKRYSYKSLIDIGRSFMAPLVQILAWLQTFSGFGTDFTNVISTLQELKALNPKQLFRTATYYRFETREAPLSKDYKLYLRDLAKQYDRTAEEKQEASTIDAEVKARAEKRKEAKSKPADLMDMPSPTLGSPSLASSGVLSPTIASPTVRKTVISKPVECFILLNYELPVADDIMVSEELTLKEHVPCLEEAEEFWGRRDINGINERVGSRLFVPYIGDDFAISLAKLLNPEENDEQKQVEQIMDESHLEEPAEATRKAVSGEEEIVDSLADWSIDDHRSVW